MDAGVFIASLRLDAQQTLDWRVGFFARGLHSTL